MSSPNVDSFINEEFSCTKPENKSFRDSTARKREELLKRQREREEQRQKLKQKSLQTIEEQATELRRLTQEELLAEAKKGFMAKGTWKKWCPTKYFLMKFHKKLS